MSKRKLSKIIETEVINTITSNSSIITPNRCSWVRNSSKLYQDYHDNEWGKPCHDERVLFEMLNLEGAQAGLSWITVLNKRENYRVAFDNWDATIISKYDQDKVNELAQNSGIIRHRGKIQAVITNSKAYLELCEEFGGLDNYLWSKVPNNSPILWDGGERIITSPLSDQISKDLKKRGFKFVGSTIIYAYLQAVGVVNDHELDCHCR